MSEQQKPVVIETVPVAELAGTLQQTLPFAAVCISSLQDIGAVELLTVSAQTELSVPGNTTRFYWIVLSGEVRAERLEDDGTRTIVSCAADGEGFGEVPMLTGKPKAPFFLIAARDSRLVRFTEDQFWKLMGSCPELRPVVLANMSQRLQTYQVEALHREKLISLGTLAAGLMHELNNPGAAARRSAAQLRENLLRMQELSLRNSNRQKTPEQMECMRSLLNHAINGGCRLKAMSSLEQADAEEDMGEWLSAAGVDNSFQIAPVLVGMGFDRVELDCAREVFPRDALSDALNWLGALVSSVSLVCAIEESITRITDLVVAVKKFAYDEKSPARELDVHDSLQSTLTILGHKLRIKQIEVVKKFEASPSVIRTRGSALSQVWTNLIDNAVDASPEGGHVEISTSTDPEQGWLTVSITDHGSGIAADVLPRIFEPFFTTKPQGSGTGLGLEIVHRIVTKKFGGTISVTSEPGRTSFTVRLPLAAASEPGASPKA
ncbi:MAG: ATP-binding protein [Terracidiphilus sp.]|nr:ATP-binding protein [Terracidiphilus sp.]